MKLVIVTAVTEYHDKVLSLFKNANIQTFSSSNIDGYKQQSALLATSSWFPSMKGGNDSHMYFSFTEEALIDQLIDGIKNQNKNLTTDNLIRAIVLPVEQYV